MPGPVGVLRRGLGILARGHILAPEQAHHHDEEDRHEEHRENGPFDEETLFAAAQTIENAAGRISLPKAWWA